MPRYVRCQWFCYSVEPNRRITPHHYIVYIVGEKDNKKRTSAKIINAAFDPHHETARNGPDLGS